MKTQHKQSLGRKKNNIGPRFKDHKKCSDSGDARQSLEVLPEIIVIEAFYQRTPKQKLFMSMTIVGYGKWMEKRTINNHNDRILSIQNRKLNNVTIRAKDSYKQKK